ncbi:hypothetical protein PHSY_002094 [Pseudozyma hubeiensis SY62]|uniref:Uncharacterized protein n=1 Tax=Pseudozyma hubeiensis (strain SY62) TaxID=1305764 RepID=R9P0G3_PSEHS|nr:hypothetical protein PHSY_002094 [Pseudozyma hubeiensis SY62]GAC94522.1 hypothetical protein PHSY_002094 [Pseudozyma hubeiensis SY62]
MFDSRDTSSIDSLAILTMAEVREDVGTKAVSGRNGWRMESQGTARRGSFAEDAPTIRPPVESLSDVRMPHQWKGRRDTNIRQLDIPQEEKQGGSRLTAARQPRMTSHAPRSHTAEPRYDDDCAARRTSAFFLYNSGPSFWSAQPQHHEGRLRMYCAIVK